MRSNRNIQDYLNDILTAIDDIEIFIRDLTFEEFLSDKKTAYSVTRALEIIGEASAQVDDAVKNQHLEIPWQKMKGLRNKIIHEYFSIHLDIIWKTIEKDLPLLKHQIKEFKQGL